MARDKQVVLSFEDSLRKLDKEIKALSTEMEAACSDAIRGIAESAYASIVSRAQAELDSTRQDYLKALSFHDLGNGSFLIALDGRWANMLEDGFGPFDMRTTHLKSNKIVGVGSRAGQPWVRESKPDKSGKKHKYAYVPFEHRPFAKAGKAGDMAEAVRAIKGTNAKGRLQKITSVFKDLEGNPMQGLVAIADPKTVGHPDLENLIKYQQVFVNSKGKQSVRSMYMTYRAMSEIGRPWIHPGNPGVSFFKDAEEEIVKQLDKIIQTLL